MANIELIFNQDGDSIHMHEIIMNAFPMLLQCGGYTLLVASGVQLVIVTPPQCGLTVKYLRDIINRSILYIRPLQRDVMHHDKSISAMVGQNVHVLLLTYFCLCRLSLPSQKRFALSATPECV